MTARRQLPDVEYLRELVVRCLHAGVPQRDSALAEMQTRRAKGEMVLKPPSGTYAVETEDGLEVGRKPAHAQWTNTVHATPTRPAGFSREAIMPSDFIKARYVRAIWSLEPMHIDSIMARYSPSADWQRSARSRLSVAAAANYCARDVRQRARFIARALLDGRSDPDTLRRAFVMTPAEWRSSPHRKMVSEMSAWLAEVDVASLQAWESRVSSGARTRQ